MGEGVSSELTLEDHILPAFQKYAQKHSKDEARKILKQFHAKSVSELDEKHWPTVLKLLK